MRLDDLRLQELGSDWIGERDPVVDATSRIGDGRVPTAVERRAAIARLAGGRAVVEGLFLTGEQRHLVLVETAAEHDELILDGEPSLAVPRVPAASPSLGISHAAGFRPLQPG